MYSLLRVITLFHWTAVFEKKKQQPCFMIEIEKKKPNPQFKFANANLASRHCLRFDLGS